jgi:Integrase core domain.
VSRNFPTTDDDLNQLRQRGRGPKSWTLMMDLKVYLSLQRNLGTIVITLKNGRNYVTTIQTFLTLCYQTSSILAKQHHLIERWLFHVDDCEYDLSSIVDAGLKSRIQAIYHTNTNGRKIVFDTGASVSISAYEDDFVQLDTRPEAIRRLTLRGLTGTAVVKGVGKIKLLVYTDTGAKQYIETMAYYVPNANINLLSVQNYIQEVKDGSKFLVDEYGTSFHFPKKTGGGRLTFNLETSNGLPCTISYSGQHDGSQNQSEDSNTTNTQYLYNVIREANINLSPGQKELLKWHFRLGHWNLQWIQTLIRKQILYCADNRASKPDSYCQCAACNLSKQIRKSEETIGNKLNIEKDGSLRKEMLEPGACISTDQYVSHVPGRLEHTYGKENTEERYIGGTLFIDEASQFIYIQNQVSLGATETIRAKHKFERLAQRHGIKIKSYRGDNGVYKTKAFKDDLELFKQTMIHSGVGAHHQNGVAERAIRTITTCARTMMIHAMIHNPNEVDKNLWPFALNYAVYLWNKMPRANGGLAPEEIFFGIKSDYADLRDARVWGCPAYVLDPKLQDGKKIPRWNPRSKLGQFVGRSQFHAANIGMIRNLRTGAVSPQFNVVYDDYFTTVGADITGDNLPVPYGFDDLMRLSRENFYEHENLPDPDHTDNANNDSVSVDQNGMSEQEGDPRLDEPQIEGAIQPDERALEGASAPEGERASEGASAPEGEDSFHTNEDPEQNVDFPHHEESGETSSSNRYLEQILQSGANAMGRYPIRNRRVNPKYFFTSHYIDYLEDTNEMSIHDLFLIECNLNGTNTNITRQYDLYNIMTTDDLDEDLIEAIHPLAFSARLNAEDTPRYHEAMNGPDAEGFREAMEKELEQLQSMHCWEVVPREKAIKRGKENISNHMGFSGERDTHVD